MGKPSDLVQGTLDLLILKTLSTEARHGWAIAKRIQQLSGEVLQVQQGSLYPALHRLEQQGWIKAKWMESETGRQAKFYSLTAAGQVAAREGDGELGAAVGGDQSDRARGVRAQGSGLRAQGSGLRAQGSGLRAQGSGLRAQNDANGLVVSMQALREQRSGARRK